MDTSSKMLFKMTELQFGSSIGFILIALFEFSEDDVSSESPEESVAF